MAGYDFSEEDLERLHRQGVPPEEARRQVELLASPPAHVRLERPCTVGDGIVRLTANERDELHSLHGEAAAAARFLKFVPASGAASRMFKELLFFQRGQGSGMAWSEVVEQAKGGSREAAALVRFIGELERFPFRDELRAELRTRDRLPELLDALLSAGGLDYEALPKGLLKFHEYQDGSRTSFEEHLVEAALYVRDETGTSRLHLTVSPEHRERFAGRFLEVREEYEARYDVRFEVDFTLQKPSTDTLAVDMEDRPLRDGQGKLLFRPGGHGALIENLNDLQADLVFIKNIDNVQPDRVKPTVVDWKKALGGYLVRLQRESFERLERLREPRPPGAVLDEAIHFTGSRLQVELNGRLGPLAPQERRAFLIDRLSRPLRVCGVVPNTGEPGGGPFWVRGGDGSVTKQIVEGAQVDSTDEEQCAILTSSTHFNPVDLVCAVRDAKGRPFDLTRYIDRDAVVIASKSAGGQELKALELPGLWNGAMAGWNTVFVEVPLETFSPVKSVLDLLREEHRSSG
jgi:hypothetical protein